MSSLFVYLFACFAIDTSGTSQLRSYHAKDCPKKVEVRKHQALVRNPKGKRRGRRLGDASSIKEELKTAGTTWGEVKKIRLHRIEWIGKLLLRRCAQEFNGEQQQGLDELHLVVRCAGCSA